MVQTPKKQWAVSDIAIQWIFGKFYEYDAIRGPEGVGQRVHDQRLHNHHVEWKWGLQKRLIVLCPYDWTRITGPEPDVDALGQAQAVSEPSNIGFIPSHILER